MKDQRESEAQERGAGTKVMFGVWFISSIVFVAMLFEFSRRYTPIFEALEVAPPGLTVMLLNVAEFLKTGQGMLVALIVQGVTLLPFLGNWARGAQPKFYAMLAIIGLLALALIWFGLVNPIDKLHALMAG